MLYWRDEPVGPTPRWIERFAPERRQNVQAFFTGNAERFIFSRPAAIRHPLRLPFDPGRFEVKRSVPMWPFGLPMDTGLPGRLIRWLDRPGAVKIAAR